MDAVADEKPPSTPVTYVLAALWVAVYLAMTWHQGGFRATGGFLGWGMILTTTSHEFGDLTAREVASGEVWRTVTATFVHFSLLHLFFNATCLLSFGRVLESWYGSAQFLAVYVAIAAMGNALAVAGRFALKASLVTHCGGGSSVLFGFIAMIAVVGWRLNTRFGLYARRNMTWKLIVYGGIMGFVGRDTLDNYGHAGGAIAGALVGLADRALLRWADRPRARVLGAAAATVLVGVTLAQAGSDRVQHARRARAIEAQTADRARAKTVFEGVLNATLQYEAILMVLDRGRGPFRSDPTGPSRKSIAESLARLDVALGDKPVGPDAGLYRRWRALATSCVARWPTPAEAREFVQLSRSVLQSALNQAQAAGFRLVLPNQYTAPR